MKVRTYVLRGGAALIVACGVPVAPQQRTAEPRFALAAFDARGLEAPLDAIPRRPELVLTSTRALEPVELVLLSGEPDADVLDDLAEAPLRAANADRGVASRVSQRGTELRLVPKQALEPDAPYIVALPGTARASGGSAISDVGPAFFSALRTLGSASAGAAWIASLPAAGARDVPLNLKTVFIAADGALKLDDSLNAAFWLETTDGAAVPSRVSPLDCAELHSRAVTCVQLEIAGALQPNAAYVVRSSAGLTDRHGAPIEPLAAAFDTGSNADLEAPSFASLACGSDELPAAFGCLVLGDTRVQVRARADESVRVAVRSWERRIAVAGAPAADRAAASMRSQAVAQLAAAGDLELTLQGLEPSAPFTLELEVTDVAGNRTTAQVELTTSAALAALTITEVLADPSGPDAAREFVEIANFGDQPVNAQGFTLADARGKPSRIAEATEVPAGARALLVANDFEPPAASFGEGTADDALQAAAVPPGTLLLHVGTSLTQGGLQNAGEPLYLRDAEGRRLSAVPLRATASGTCLQRGGTDPRSARPEDFAPGTCTPGRPP